MSYYLSHFGGEETETEKGNWSKLPRKSMPGAKLNLHSQGPCHSAESFSRNNQHQNRYPQLGTSVICGPLWHPCLLFCLFLLMIPLDLLVKAAQTIQCNVTSLKLFCGEHGAQYQTSVEARCPLWISVLGTGTEWCPWGGLDHQFWNPFLWSSVFLLWFVNRYLKFMI